MFVEKKKSVSIKTAIVFVAILLSVAIVAAAVANSKKQENIPAVASTMILGIGQEYDYPVGDNKKAPKFKSLNNDVVTVDKNGKFVAVAKGNAKVKVGKNEITVQVEDAPTGIAFARSEFLLGSGETYKLPLSVDGSDINTGFLFESSDANILSVGADGTVTGNALGTAKLTVKTYNGLSSACSVAVQNAPESISFPQENTNVFAGEKLKLAPVLPSGSASANITYASDNDAVAKAQGNEIVAVANGTANITATTFNGKSATCQITVVEAPYYIRTNLDPNKPMVALSFDDGPNKSTTTMILDALEQNHASATFFMVGNRLQYEGNKECAQRMVKLGCQLGNHTYDHSHYGNDVTAEDISGGIEAIKNATGYEPTAFRPTGGYISDTIKQNSNAPICIWSLDTNDWRHKKDSNKTYDAVMNHVSDGDIILMHDIYESTAEAVTRFVPELVAQGYQVVNIAELAYYKNASFENGQIYYSFR